MSEPRNLICPVSEVACTRAECRQGFCIVEKEDHARRADPNSTNYWSELSKTDVDREMRQIAENAITARGQRLDPETLREKCNNLLRRKHADIAAMARDNLRLIARL